MNIVIYLCILIISINLVYFSNKLLDKLGLTITYVIMSTISLLLSFKYITISTINLNSNCITYVSMLICLYLLLEKTDKKQTKEVINLNFIVNIFVSLMLYIMTCYTQSLTDTISINMKNVFDSNYQILIIYPLTTLLSSRLLILVYEKIKKIYDNHFIITVTIYLLIGIIEGVIYTTLVYNNLNIKTIILIILSTYMIRLIITVIYSIILTLLSKRKVVS